MEANNQTNGLAHLLHDKVHWEWCYDYQERVDYIKAHKPADEQAARLKYFQLLPARYLPKRLQEAAYAVRQEAAYAVWQKADAAWQEADAVRRKADAVWQEAAYAVRRKADAVWQEAAYAIWQEADAVWQKAYTAWREAYTVWLKANAVWQSSPHVLRILAQAHAELFPDCPWDEAQQTMFPSTEAI
mgnify:CR=1 FL=1